MSIKKMVLMFLSFFVFVGVGCATSTPVKKAPLASKKKKQLKNHLIGTWKHHSSADSKDANPEPKQGATITWTFRKDGTGTFSQKVPMAGVNQSRNFKWHLEGRNLALGESDPTYYRVDDWSKGEMTWFNYTMSNYFFLRKQ